MLNNEFIIMSLECPCVWTQKIMKYISFSCTGVYLVAVSANTQAVFKYSHKELVHKYARNLILVNICLLMYDAFWIMTTLAIEGGEQYLLKVLNLGCVGLVMYDICAVLALMKLQMAISSEPDSNIDCDDPSKAITVLQQLVPVFLLLSISREFNSLIFPTSLAVLLPVIVLALGSLVFTLKTYLLYSCLSTSLRPSTKQPAYQITVSSVIMVILSIYSCLVNACQGYDSYQRWLSNKHPAFTAFLAVYCTIYTLHIAYEGNFLYYTLSMQFGTRKQLLLTAIPACRFPCCLAAVSPMV